MAECNSAIKLTFIGSSGEVAALQQSLVTRAYSDGTDAWRRVSETYFDTPDKVLTKAHRSLCLCDDGDRLVQLLRASAKECPPFHDDAVMTELSDRADFPRIGASGLSYGVEPQMESRYEPLAHIISDRWTTRLIFGRSTVEMVISLGKAEYWAESGKESQAPVSEVSLRLLDGRPKDLLGLARLFARNKGLRLSFKSQLDQVLSLQKGGVFQIGRAAKILAAADEPVGQVLQRALANVAVRLAALQSPLVDGRRSAAIQQMRVALRRLRAAERIFRPHLKTGQIRDLAASAKLYARLLAPARDWDVFVDETLSMSLESDYAPLGSRDLKLQAQAMRAEGWMQASKTISDPAFTQFLIDLVEASLLAQWRKPAQKTFALPVFEFAPRALDRALKKTRKTARHLRPGHNADLHQLRIALKKLRYPVQMFRNAYPKDQRQVYMATLSRLQHHFGMVNDAMVAQRLADEAARGGGGEAIRVAGFVCGFKSAQAEAVAKAIETDWAAFEETKPFWRP